MGCGASAPKPASLTQQEEMCKWSAKAMVIVCLQYVLNEKIKKGVVPIQAPGSDMDGLRKMVTDLREAAKGLGESVGGAGDAVAEGAEKVGGAGGMLGGMIAGAVGAASKAVAGAVGGAGGSVLNGLAGTIEGQVAKVDAEFAKIAGTVAEANTPEIVAVYQEVLNTADFQKCLELCRGAEPFGQAEYDACEKDKITKAFMKAAGDKIAGPLITAVDAEIDKSTLVSTWEATINNVNDANKKMTELLKVENKEAIKLDIKEYIVAEIIKKIAEEMNTYEADIRVKPDDTRPPQAAGTATFNVCLSGKAIMAEDYKAFTKGN